MESKQTNHHDMSMEVIKRYENKYGMRYINPTDFFKLFPLLEGLINCIPHASITDIENENNVHLKKYILTFYTESGQGKLVLYSHQHKYTINVRKPHPSKKAPYDNGYLGVCYDVRMSRTGEDWTRGRDITDGDYNKATMKCVLQGIIKSELDTLALVIPELPNVPIEGYLSNATIHIDKSEHGKDMTGTVKGKATDGKVDVESIYVKIDGKDNDPAVKKTQQDPFQRLTGMITELGNQIVGRTPDKEMTTYYRRRLQESIDLITELGEEYYRITKHFSDSMVELERLKKEQAEPVEKTVFEDVLNILHNAKDYVKIDIGLDRGINSVREIMMKYYYNVRKLEELRARDSVKKKESSLVVKREIEWTLARQLLYEWNLLWTGKSHLFERTPEVTKQRDNALFELFKKFISKAGGDDLIGAPLTVRGEHRGNISPLDELNDTINEFKKAAEDFVQEEGTMLDGVNIIKTGPEEKEEEFTGLSDNNVLHTGGKSINGRLTSPADLKDSLDKLAKSKAMKEEYPSSLGEFANQELPEAAGHITFESTAKYVTEQCEAIKRECVEYEEALRANDPVDTTQLMKNVIGRTNTIMLDVVARLDIMEAKQKQFILEAIESGMDTVGVDNNTEMSDYAKSEPAETSNKMEDIVFLKFNRRFDGLIKRIHRVIHDYGIAAKSFKVGRGDTKELNTLEKDLHRVFDKLVSEMTTLTFDEKLIENVHVESIYYPHYRERADKNMVVTMNMIAEHFDRIEDFLGRQNPANVDRARKEIKQLSDAIYNYLPNLAGPYFTFEENEHLYSLIKGSISLLEEQSLDNNSILNFELIDNLTTALEVIELAQDLDQGYDSLINPEEFKHLTVKDMTEMYIHMLQLEGTLTAVTASPESNTAVPLQRVRDLVKRFQEIVFKASDKSVVIQKGKESIDDIGSKSGRVQSDEPNKSTPPNNSIIEYIDNVFIGLGNHINNFYSMLRQANTSEHKALIALENTQSTFEFYKNEIQKRIKESTIHPYFNYLQVLNDVKDIKDTYSANYVFKSTSEMFVELRKVIDNYHTMVTGMGTTPKSERQLGLELKHVVDSMETKLLNMIPKIVSHNPAAEPKKAELDLTEQHILEEFLADHLNKFEQAIGQPIHNINITRNIDDPDNEDVKLYTIEDVSLEVGEPKSISTDSMEIGEVLHDVPLPGFNGVRGMVMRIPAMTRLKVDGIPVWTLDPIAIQYFAPLQLVGYNESNYRLEYKSTK